MSTRKSKITELFDWQTYQKAIESQKANPKDSTTTKTVEKLQKELQTFQSRVSKDLKIGLAALQDALAQDGKKGSIPYFLHLDYFATSGGGSLLILGTHPNIKKAFKAASKTKEKVNISVGQAHLDSNDILQLEPTKNGMKVKAKTVVTALKQDPIKKSKPGFWSKRKVNNVIIGTGESSPTDTTLTGDSSLVEEKVTYTAAGVNSEIYDQFKSFVNRDYINSNGTRNKEYFAATLQQIEKWTTAIRAEYKSKADASLKAAYKQMGKEMLVFKKQVQQDAKDTTSQHISQDSSLATFEQLFDREWALKVM